MIILFHLFQDTSTTISLQQICIYNKANLMYHLLNEEGNGLFWWCKNVNNKSPNIFATMQTSYRMYFPWGGKRSLNKALYGWLCIYTKRMNKKIGLGLLWLQWFLLFFVSPFLFFCPSWIKKIVKTKSKKERQYKLYYSYPCGFPNNRTNASFIPTLFHRVQFHSIYSN